MIYKPHASDSFSSFRKFRRTFILKTFCTRADMLRIIFLMFALTTPAANQPSSLLTRLGKLEHRVDVLENEVEELKTGVSPQVKLDFKITNISAVCDTDCSFTLLYEAKGDKPTVLIAKDGEVPTLHDHNRGTIHFTTSRGIVSPMVYVGTTSGFNYMLTLIRPGGPDPATNLSNVAISSEPSITFNNGDQPVFDFSSSIIGSRKVKNQDLEYDVCTLSSSDTNNAPVETIRFGGDEERDRGRLHVLDSKEDGDDMSYRFRLDTSHEDAGLLTLEYSVEWDCTGGCILYSTTVRVPVLYYREDLYEMSDGDLLPHRIGESHDYLKFISYRSYDSTSYSVMEGDSFFISCPVIGEDPQVGWLIPEEVTARTEFVNIGYTSYNFLSFQNVTKEDEGNYTCWARSMSKQLWKTFTLEMIEPEYGDYTGPLPGQ